MGRRAPTRRRARCDRGFGHAAPGKFKGQPAAEGADDDMRPAPASRLLLLDHRVGEGVDVRSSRLYRRTAPVTRKGRSEHIELPLKQREHRLPQPLGGASTMQHNKFCPSASAIGRRRRLRQATARGARPTGKHPEILALHPPQAAPKATLARFHSETM